MKRILLLSIFLLIFSQESFSIIVIGKQKFTVTINDQETELTVADVAASANNDELTINDRTYQLNPTWSFFGLLGEEFYTIDNYGLVKNCGCFKQICGSDCQQGVECHNTDVDDPPYFCMSWTTRKGFCVAITRSPTGQQFSSYMLTHLATIALTGYGGPKAPDSGDGYLIPGYTIRDQYSQNYSYNAMITGSTPRRKVDISIYRYAESEGRIVFASQVEKLNEPPKLIVNWTDSNCLDNGTAHIPNSIAYKTPLSKNFDVPDFHSYLILRGAKVEKLESLLNQKILSTTGVLEWNNQKTFTILDPCNQQFLTLQKSVSGSYFVNVPVHQRLLEDSIICIAVNDITTTQYDLVLYEMKNESNLWTASSRFVGILSQDYLDNLQLRITTDSKIDVKVSDAQIDVDVNTEIYPPILKVTTSTAITCTIHLSKNCSYNITTTKDQMYATIPIKKCGWLYEIAAYSCQGIFGTFHPPSKLVNAPINNYTENTTINDIINSGGSVNPPDNNRGLISTIAHWFVDWSPSNFLDKILTIAILGGILVASFYVCLFCTEAKVAGAGINGILGAAAPMGLSQLSAMANQFGGLSQRISPPIQQRQQQRYDEELQGLNGADEQNETPRTPEKRASSERKTQKKRRDDYSN
jgi:hypothetical protein